jgi:hypothetical protein
MRRVGQNTSNAVMASRIEPHDSLDDFPTPPWATRALIEYVLMPALSPSDAEAMLMLRTMSVLEPAANRGHMAKPLAEYFGVVLASDIFDYGVGFERADFLFGKPKPAEWVITNPPFRLAEQFIDRSFDAPGWQGTAVIVRSAFLETVGRYDTLFRNNPPSIIAQFSERVPMVKGRLTAEGSTATAYCWLVWQRGGPNPRFVWIPPCRKVLERDGDYP